jgi:hypothetical protein
MQSLPTDLFFTKYNDGNEGGVGSFDQRRRLSSRPFLRLLRFLL